MRDGVVLGEEPDFNIPIAFLSPRGYIRGISNSYAHLEGKWVQDKRGWRSWRVSSTTINKEKVLFLKDPQVSEGVEAIPLRAENKELMVVRDIPV